MVQRGLAVVDTIGAIGDLVKKDLTASQKVKAAIPKLARIGLTAGSIVISSGLAGSLVEKLPELAVAHDLKNLADGAKNLFGTVTKPITDSGIGKAIGGFFSRMSMRGAELLRELPSSDQIIEDGLGVNGTDLVEGFNENGVDIYNTDSINNFMQGDDYKPFENAAVENAADYHGITAEDFEPRSLAQFKGDEEVRFQMHDDGSGKLRPRPMIQTDGEWHFVDHSTEQVIMTSGRINLTNLKGLTEGDRATFLPGDRDLAIETPKDLERNF